VADLMSPGHGAASQAASQHAPVRRQLCGGWGLPGRRPRPTLPSPFLLCMRAGR